MPRAAKNKPKAVPLVSAATRALVVLERLSGQRDLGLEDLSRKLKMAKPTVYRFLLTLQHLGYVRRTDGDRWSMTMKAFNVSSRALDQLDLYSAGRAVAEDLSETLGETTHMGVLDGDSAVYVLKIESRHTIRMFSRVGRRIPLYCTAIGKVLLAFLPGAARETVLKEVHRVACTRNTLTTRATLDAELERIRLQGFALDAEEYEEGIHCIGAPIFDPTGAVVATLSVSWPDFRYRREEEAEYVHQVKAAAARVSGILGHTR